MGEVWRATEIFSGNAVAIKILRRATESFVTRFRTECRYYTKLRHDNIVRMARAGVAEDGVLYIVMELLEGRTLREIVNGTSKKRLPLLHALHVVIQLADAMQYVHRKGIYHRDLKPENLMVSTAEETKGHLWIVDFGIATFANPHEPGALDSKELPEVGTLFYLSPEQARPGRLKPDGRADIYSFGVILYELLAGRHPFVRGDEPTTPEAILNGHLCAEIQPLHEIIEELPAEVWDVTARCLARSVEARYQTFEEVGQALRSLMRSSLPPDHYIAKRILREKQAQARRATFDHAIGHEGDPATKTRRPPPIPRTGLHLDAHRVKTVRGNLSSPVFQAALAASRQTEELPTGYTPSTPVTPFRPTEMSLSDFERTPAQSEEMFSLDRASIQGESLPLAEPEESALRASAPSTPNSLNPSPEPETSAPATGTAPYAFKPVAVTDVLLPVSPELQRVRDMLREKSRATAPSYAPSITSMNALAYGGPPRRETLITPPTPLAAAITPAAARVWDRSMRAMVVAPFIGLGMAALLVMTLLGVRWARDHLRAPGLSPSVQVSAAPPPAAPSTAISTALTEAPRATASPVVYASAGTTPAPSAPPKQAPITPNKAPPNKRVAPPPTASAQTAVPTSRPLDAPAPPTVSPAPKATAKRERMFGQE